MPFSVLINVIPSGNRFTLVEGVTLKVYIVSYIYIYCKKKVPLQVKLTIRLSNYCVYFEDRIYMQT